MQHPLHPCTTDSLSSSASLSLKLHIIENVSGYLVELLESRFAIDPEFFENHYFERNQKPLLASLQQRKWLEIRSVEIRLHLKLLDSWDLSSNIIRPVTTHETLGSDATVRETQHIIWIGSDPIFQTQRLVLCLEIQACRLLNLADPTSFARFLLKHHRD